jgi:hypothetical protein
MLEWIVPGLTFVAVVGVLVRWALGGEGTRAPALVALPPIERCAVCARERLRPGRRLRYDS